MDIMVRSTDIEHSKSSPSQSAWYCLRCQTKKERIAAIHLRKEAGVDVFAPRISFYKKTRNGKKRFVEALFPGYVFVHCNIRECLRVLLSMRGIIGIVRYGNIIPNLPDQLIANLIDRFPNLDEPIQINQNAFEPGSEVTVVKGAFKNLSAVVEHYLPAKERIQVLINFLGRDVSLKLPSKMVLAAENKNVRSDFCFDY